MNLAILSSYRLYRGIDYEGRCRGIRGFRYDALDSDAANAAAAFKLAVMISKDRLTRLSAFCRRAAQSAPANQYVCGPGVLFFQRVMPAAAFVARDKGLR
jgi:hypothetical protein